MLSDSESFEQWTERGGKDTAQRTFELWNRLLEDHQTPPLDPAINEALIDYMDGKAQHARRLILTGATGRLKSQLFWQTRKGQGRAGFQEMADQPKVGQI